MTALVVGVGNALRRDDGAGLEVARRLRALGVRAIERDGEPARLLVAWEGEADVVVVDAVDAGAAPGTIVRFDAVAGALPARLFRGSSHDLGVADAVELGRVLGRLPARLDVIAIAGARFDAGEGLSPAVERAVATVVAELGRASDRPAETVQRSDESQRSSEASVSVAELSDRLADRPGSRRPGSP